MIAVVNKRAYEVKVRRRLRNGITQVYVIGLGDRETFNNWLVDVSKNRDFIDAQYEYKSAYAEHLWEDGILSEDATEAEVEAAWADFKPYTELQFVKDKLKELDINDELDLLDDPKYLAEFLKKLGGVEK